jgi:MerR family transcriptional regulator/heat shock protein HspR
MAYIKDRDEPIYTISIAAKLVRPLAKAASADQKPIHAQTLRMYDRLGLVKPQKVGKNRFYSDRDIERLQRIQHFTQHCGINLAGVAYILELVDQLQEANLQQDRIDMMLQAAEERLREWTEVEE